MLPTEQVVSRQENDEEVRCQATRDVRSKELSQGRNVGMAVRNESHEPQSEENHVIDSNKLKGVHESLNRYHWSSFSIDFNGDCAQILINNYARRATYW